MTGSRVARTDGEQLLRSHEDRILALERAPRGIVRMPWILFHGSLNGLTVPGGGGSIVDVFPELTGLLVSPLNDGGTVDPAVYGGIDPGGSPIPVMDNLGNSNEPFKAIQILEPGLYYFEVGMTWYYDWTIQEPFAERWATVRQDVSHTDGDTSIVNVSSYVLSTDQTYIGLVPQGGDLPLMPLAFQLTARTHLAIDERATDVELRGLINNFSDADRTYNNTDRSGSLTFYVVRLSPFPDSNPPAA